MIRFKPIRDSLLFCDLLECSENVEELSENADYLLDQLRTAIMDLCSDNDWAYEDIESDAM